jgi:TolB protein
LKTHYQQFHRLRAGAVVAVLATVLVTAVRAQITIEVDVAPGTSKPIWLSLEGLTGEAAEVLRFDLYVQGFNFTNAQAAQYNITGSNNENLQARATDRFTKQQLLSKAYSGAPLRRQAHAFADDFVQALGRKPIAQTKIAFKGGANRGSEVFVSDFDGRNALGVTRDGSTVYYPSWVPGKMALYYGSYTLNRAAIFYHDLGSGNRKAFARYGGSNLSPAVSPDGRRVAMVLSKDGWPDLYVCNSDGTDLKRLTTSRQDESSPCWSPDGQFVCFAGRVGERRSLCKIPAGGGAVQTISTGGVPSPTEPDWSPDGKWIAFTAQFKTFQVCVVPASGGTATVLVEGEDPSWSPNSRTVAYCRRSGGGDYVLSLLDVPTKQYKDVSRISGSNSQSQPSWAR